MGEEYAFKSSVCEPHLEDIDACIQHSHLAMRCEGKKFDVKYHEMDKN